MPPEYKPVPSVAPTDRPTPERSIAFGRIDFTQSIGAAIGELGRGSQVLGGATTQVGAAIGQLGQSISKAGDEIWDRAVAIKQVENQTAATEAESNYMRMAAQQSEAFRALDGNAASQGLDAHMKGLEDLRKQIRDSLPNQQAQHFYDHQSLRTMGSAVWMAAKHAKDQGKAAALGAANANFKLQLNDLENHANDYSDEQLKQKEDDLIQFHKDRIATLDGTGTKGPQAELKRLEIISQITAAKISGIGKKDPERALDMLANARKEGKILAAAANQLEGQLTGKREEISIRNESDRAMDKVRKDHERDRDAPVPTQQEVEERAIKGLPEDLQKNATAVQAVRDRINHDYNSYRKGEAQAQEDAYQRLANLANPVEGAALTKPEQVWAANPKAQSDYALLLPTGPNSRKSFRDLLKHNMDGNNRFDPLESGQLTQDIKGALDRGGDAAVKALTINPWDPSLHLNVDDRRALQKAQERVRLHPTGRNEVHTAFQWLKDDFGQAMTDLRIIGSNRDETMTNKAYGTIGAAIDRWAQTHAGAAPTRDDFKKSIGPEILQHSAGTWFPYRPAVPSMIEREPPADFVTGYRAYVKDQEGVDREVTKDELHRAYQMHILDVLEQERKERKTAPAGR